MSSINLKDSDYQRVHNYLEQWKCEEGWTDLNVALDRGDTLYAAAIMASSGAIDQGTKIEKLVLEVAREFETLSDTDKQNHIDDTFKDCFISSCKDCNAVQFLDCGNEKLYPEVKENCWECGSKNIETYYWPTR